MLNQRDVSPRPEPSFSVGHPKRVFGKKPVLSCPSARAEAGAELIGIVGPDGKVQAVQTPMMVDEDFIARASRHGSPEARFRFSNTCVEGRCSQWTGQSCGVVEKVLSAMTQQGIDAAEAPPRCGIRGTCRWYHQRGADACRACIHVVTDQTAC